MADIEISMIDPVPVQYAGYACDFPDKGRFQQKIRRIIFPVTAELFQTNSVFEFFSDKKGFESVRRGSSFSKPAIFMVAMPSSLHLLIAFSSFRALTTGHLRLKMFFSISPHPILRWIFTKYPLPSLTKRSVVRFLC